MVVRWRKDGALDPMGGGGQGYRSSLLLIKMNFVLVCMSPVTYAERVLISLSNLSCITKSHILFPYIP